MLPRLRQWSRAAASRLPALVPTLPTSCALCGAGDKDALCPDCRDRYLAHRRARPLCACCGIAVPVAIQRCGDCLRAAPTFDATFAAADYAPPLDRLVLALKFGGRLELATLLAALLAETVKNLPPTEMPALLVPVPLGRRRLAERGFNQALEIAKPLGRAIGVPVARALALRVRDTEAQSLLHPDERRSNVANAFSLRPDAVSSVHGLHIGIVDDVMTTGETLHSLAATLKQAGAARVSNFVFARTPAA